MGTSQSREDYISDSDYEEESESGESSQYDDAQETSSSSSSRGTKTTLNSLDEVDSRLKSLKLKYANPLNPNLKNPVKLYLHIGGNTPKAKWIVSDKLTSYSFIKTLKVDGGNASDDDDEGDGDGGDGLLGFESWVQS
ncbi:hypothetical protein Patl1_36138 [Pistacia atlantica]|nr:hypothetical protein Patl1_36138 [Pistacia atlantica]